MTTRAGTIAVATAGLGLLAALIPMFVPGRAPAQSGAAMVVWSGLMRCGVIPGLTTVPLRQPVTVVVENGQASFRREVHKPDSSGYAGYYEQGSSPVAADGNVTLRGGALGKGVQMQSTYAGILPPAGGSTRLVGTQQWFTRRTNMVSRACVIDLHR